MTHSSSTSRTFRPHNSILLGADMLTIGMLAFWMLAFGIGCRSDEDPRIPELQRKVQSLSQTIGDLDSRISEIESAKTEAAKSESPSHEHPDDQVIFPATYRENPSILDDPFIGPKRAKVLVMIFSNFQCRPCRMFHKTTFQELRDKYGSRDDVQIVLRDFPLENNPSSVAASALAHCAGETGGYWKMFDALTTSDALVDGGNIRGVAEKYDRAQATRLMQCVESNRYSEEIELDRKDGLDLGAKGAPGLFVGRRDDSGDFQGVFIRGAQPTALIEQEIHKVLKTG